MGVDRESLSFAQAEGAESLPSQLRREEISDQMASMVWALLHAELEKALDYGDGVYAILTLRNPWKSILQQWWVFRKHRNIDEFPEPDRIKSLIKAEITTKEYIRFYDFLQFIARHPLTPKSLISMICSALEFSNSSYRLINNTFIPITSKEEAEAIEDALREASKAKALGPSAHLSSASSFLSEGKWSEAIRESIHAVEAAARSIEPEAATLGPALSKLETTIGLNPALKKAFGSLYGYASDEKGIRHSLVFGSKANVGEKEAVFMFGACASFVSFLLSASREGGHAQS